VAIRPQQLGGWRTLSMVTRYASFGGATATEIVKSKIAG
jgi:hypothetical protein